MRTTSTTLHGALERTYQDKGERSMPPGPRCSRQKSAPRGGRIIETSMVHDRAAIVLRDHEAQSDAWTWTLASSSSKHESSTAQYGVSQQERQAQRNLVRYESRGSSGLQANGPCVEPNHIRLSHCGLVPSSRFRVLRKEAYHHRSHLPHR